MKLTFRIEYRTAWGEELGVILDGNNSEPIILRTPNGNIGKVKLKCRISLHAYLFPTAMEYIVTDSASAVKAEPWLICFVPGKRKTATTY